MAPFFRRLRGDSPINALRTLTLYSFLYCTSPVAPERGGGRGAVEGLVVTGPVATRRVGW